MKEKKTNISSSFHEGDEIGECVELQLGWNRLVVGLDKFLWQQHPEMDDEIVNNIA